MSVYNNSLIVWYYPLFSCWCIEVGLPGSCIPIPGRRRRSLLSDMYISTVDFREVHKISLRWVIPAPDYASQTQLFIIFNHIP